jgi:hypothetical protein
MLKAGNENLKITATKSLNCPHDFVHLLKYTPRIDSLKSHLPKDIDISETARSISKILALF